MILSYCLNRAQFADRKRNYAWTNEHSMKIIKVCSQFEIMSEQEVTSTNSKEGETPTNDTPSCVVDCVEQYQDVTSTTYPCKAKQILI